MSEMEQVMQPPRASNGTLHRKREIAAWPFFRLWKVSDPTLFQMTLLAALLAIVVGDCGLPPNLPFASPINTLNETRFKTGTVLKYNCRPGYSRALSSQTLVCKVRGQWEYSDFCVKKRCKNPGDLPNGQVEIKTDLSFGSKLEFSCSEGYILIGSTTSHCEIQDRGVEWSDPLPQCEIVKCESPPHISNGKHSGGDEQIYAYGSSVTYTCDPSFSLLGEASISCTVENKTIGVWSPSPPTCEKITCSQPSVPHGSVVSGFGHTYSYKDSIVFKCQKGYILRGNSLIHCEAGNMWNPSPPICEPNSCIGLPDIPHAFWEGYHRTTEGDIYDIGTVLRFHCDAGYKPIADEPTIVTCQKNLRWTPFSGCEEVCCPIPDPKKIKITQHKKNRAANSCAYFYRDRISYTCDESYEFSATCQSDGTWSPQTPSCNQGCRFPPSIAHGHHRRVTSYIIPKDEFIYECDEGYTLVGQAKLSCSSSGWSHPAPQCKALCVKPDIVHGKLSVNKRQYIESENITIRCDSGYGVLGPQMITCSENRTWYPEVPTCEWEVPEGCEHVLAGRNLMQCLPRPEDVKMALELYKLSLEIELLELQRDKEKLSTLELLP
ncbi:C4b-binding protein alpha chain [Cynocephalus volans]|uniref:C4b-binding protein alpha chain n=1 Tax=Cynocephalus volans TaxID=110931 RepID=UPI002FCC0536